MLKVGDKLYAIDNHSIDIKIETVKKIDKKLNIIETENYVLEYNNEILKCYKPTDLDVDFCLFFKTKNKAIKQAKKEIKGWIKSFKGSILEHKEYLKKLTKMEKEND